MASACFVFLALSALGGVLMALAHRRVSRTAQGRLYREPEAVPAHETALVLGTAERLADGTLNRFFTYRVEAAAALYHAGKVRRFLLSGSGEEPAALARRLQESGVPATILECDPGGLRTLASLQRARETFRLRQVVIVSQPFHVERALYLAPACGLEAVGFGARDVSPRAAIKVHARECLARLRAVFDRARLGSPG